MRIQVNGQWQQLSDGMTVASLLEALRIDPRRAAVERNSQLVRRADHAHTSLMENDAIEIVTLVGGG